MEALLPFSIWSSISPWLSPLVLFLFLHIVIGIIALTSKLYHSQTTDSDHINDPHRLIFSRQPSVLERLKSFNLSLYHSIPKPEEEEEEEEEEEDKFKEEEDQNQDSRQVLSRPPSFLERIRSFKLYPNGSDGDVVVEKTDHISRNQSNPSPKRTGKKLTRSASERTEALKAEEDEYGRRLMTMRGGDRKNRLDLSSDDEEEEKEENINGEVDARADDFISKFRQQLKLQRLDSILRYTEMLNRGK